ncbi:MAG: c-type cytochrome [Phycisphaerales bacterium]
MTQTFSQPTFHRTAPSRRAGVSRDTNPDPYRWHTIGVGAMVALTLPAILAVIFLTQPGPPKHAWSEAALALGVEPYEITVGEGVYRNSCAVCHGPNGEGIHRLGKPLRNSAYVQARTDDELFRLIVDGRKISDPENTSGALMPPRGARGIPDSSVEFVVKYLRAIQDESAALASVAPWDLKSNEAGDGSGGGLVAALELTDHPGYDVFVASCAACHGQGAEGIDQLGLPLSTSGFIRSQSDKELITFIKMGRASWDENNTTGLDMPPKGGNPAINDAQLQSIIDYLRAVQTETMGS